MSDVYELLSRSDRNYLDKLADRAGLHVDDMIPEIVSAWLTLHKDAPNALPTDPLARLSSAVRKRGGR